MKIDPVDPAEFDEDTLQAFVAKFSWAELQTCADEDWVKSQASIVVNRPSDEEVVALMGQIQGLFGGLNTTTIFVALHQLACRLFLYGQTNKEVLLAGNKIINHLTDEVFKKMVNRALTKDCGCNICDPMRDAVGEYLLEQIERKETPIC